MGKALNCPNCGGRSFDASGGDATYFTCNLCERPTEEFHDWYKTKWPEVYAKWHQSSSESGKR